MSNIFTVTLPDIGEGVVEGEVIEWLKEIGDTLSQDEPVVIVMTDKATVELPAPHPGKLAKKHFEKGETAIKDRPLYDIAVAGEVATTKKRKEEKKKKGKKEKKEITATIEKAPCSATPIPPSRPSGERSLATPPIRKMAKELSIDINQVSGSGKDGRVTKEDLRRHLAGATTANPAPVSTTAIPVFEGDSIEPLLAIRNLVAKKMSESKRMIPHFSFFDRANMRYLIQLREKLKPTATAQGLKLSYMPFFIRALSLTLKKFPHFNASVDPVKNALVTHKPHNIAIAMKTNMGLIVPVLKEVETMNLEAIVKAYNLLREKALSNKLEPHDMKNSTVTISNFGTEGGLWATPVINYPEAFILATARIEEIPVVKEGEIIIRPVMNCSWSFDHRIIDGDMAASFSKLFISLIENPSRIL